MTKLFVRLYSSVANPDGVPGVWPANVEEVADNTPNDGRVVFATKADYDAYRALHQATYDAWAAPRNAAALILAKTEDLDRENELDAGKLVTIGGREVRANAFNLGALNALVTARASFAYPIRVDLGGKIATQFDSAAALATFGTQVSAALLTKLTALGVRKDTIAGGG